MANHEPPSSSLPPSMGPGARPVQPGIVAGANGSPGDGLAEVMHIRSSYKIDVQSESLNLSYDLRGNIRSQRLLFDSIPLSDFKRWLLFGGPRRSYASGVQVIDYIRAAENMAGRPTTQREAEGLAYHASQRISYTMYGNFVGTLIGGTIAFRTREIMKFPFRKAQPLDKYDNFPSRRIPILTGGYARTSWHITRANIWAMLCVLVVTPLFTSMGDITTMAGLTQDERTKEIASEVRGSIERIASNRAGAARNRRGSQQSTETQSDQRQQDQNQALSQDWGRDTSPYDDSGSSDFSKDDASKRQQQIQPSMRGFGNVNNRTGGNVPQQDAPSAPESDPFFYDDDDASPTAGNRPRPAGRAPNDRSQSGSVWARIRRGDTSASSDQSAQQSDYSSSSSSPAPSPRGWNRPGGQRQDSQFENSGDSFSFSKTEADKQFAREQAQKEFDAMLERERRESGSDDYDRGMKAIESGQESQAASGMSAWEQRRRRN